MHSKRRSGDTRCDLLLLQASKHRPLSSRMTQPYAIVILSVAQNPFADQNVEARATPISKAAELPNS